MFIAAGPPFACRSTNIHSSYKPINLAARGRPLIMQIFWIVTMVETLRGPRINYRRFFFTIHPQLKVKENGKTIKFNEKHFAEGKAKRLFTIFIRDCRRWGVADGWERFDSLVHPPLDSMLTLLPLDTIILIILHLYINVGEGNRRAVRRFGKKCGFI